MSVLKTAMIIPNKGLIRGEPELLEPGVLTDAENVVLHPTLGIQTRPGIFTNGTLHVDSEIANIRLIKTVNANINDYLFILGADSMLTKPNTLYIYLVDINKKSANRILKLNRFSNAKYYDYFVDSSTNAIISDASKLKLHFSEDKIWIVNTTKLVVSSMAIEQGGSVTSFTHEIVFGKQMSGELPMIYIVVGEQQILIRNAYSISSSNPKESLINLMKADIVQALTQFSGYSVTSTADSIKITGSSSVSNIIELKKDTASNPWTVSGTLTPSREYTFTFKHKDKFDKPANSMYWDAFRLRGKFVGDSTIYTTNYIRPANFENITVTRTSGPEIIGRVISANVSEGNAYTTSVRLASNFYILDFYYDDRDFFGGSDSSWLGWKVIYDGETLKEDNRQFKLKDETWHSINTIDYMAQYNTYSHNTLITYNQTADGSAAHSSPQVSLSVTIGNSQLFSSNEYLDSSGLSLYSGNDLLDQFVTKYSALLSPFFISVTRTGNVITLNAPITYSISIEFSTSEKEINIVPANISGENFSSVKLELQESSLPCYIDLKNHLVDRPPLFKANAVNYKNTFTSSVPSFANSHIQDLKIIQDRMFLLSDNAISISEVGTRDKFFLSATQQLVDTSYIDVKFSVEKGHLNDLIFLNKEFYIFGTQQQFLLHFDGYISPFTILIQNLTDYQISEVQPIVLGNEIFFGNKTQVYRNIERHMLYSFFVQPNTYTNKAENKSWMINDIMPEHINQLVAINDKVLLLYNERNNNFTSAMVFHRFTNNLEVIQEGWTKWKFPTDLGLFHVNTSGDVITIKVVPSGLQGADNHKFVLLFYKIPLEQDVTNALWDEIYTSPSGDIVYKDIMAKVALPIFTKDIPPYLRARLDFVHLIFDKEFTGYVYYGQDGKISEVLGTINNALYASVPIRKYARGAEVIIESAAIIEGNPNMDNERHLLANPLNLMGFGAEFRVWNRKYGKY